MNEYVLQLENITKSFRQGDGELVVLKDASLQVKKGEMVALVGPSGCGKSTLLQIAGLLDYCNSGKVIINGIEVGKLSDRRRTAIRRDNIGFVYQNHHLLPDFSAIENVMIPQIIAGKSKKQAYLKAEEILIRLGLAQRKHHRPAELSGGEQQRVAIARALINSPTILLADEPTGNLDLATSNVVFTIMLEQVKIAGLSMLMVTHNMDLAAKTDRIITRS